ncbi:8bfe390d-2ea1-4d76-b3e3-bd0eb1963ccb [Thermothielavioides terrestris]|uniref:8bfe390d-2ea1-4d76-b3e3-bd0eb1963ccb n=1 Tax=Thermothielavioides terrestris TaxID=2587410 RepID=A0A3S5CXD9_9PEZI|nr:8bfe390d-2ea1-4d76-b3e3-bd0eb1963ccb [Thermothielavioides terrestris]
MKSTPPPVLPIEAGSSHGDRASSRSRRCALVFIALVLLLLVRFPDIASFKRFIPSAESEQDFGSGCAQPDPLFPSNHPELDKAFEHISSESFRNATIRRLSGAVQVRTESFDDLGAIGEDPRWDVFYDFHQYLEKTFPLIHEKLLVEKVNTHGLLYTWKGSDESLKPTLLMAHQDTVPVPPETVPDWTYPPWSGAYDGKNIWGRGASDCKNQLIAAMETLELLLEAGFQPKRTILLSFGFDEECSGTRGASHLAAFIQERYGKDGIAVIVDEGSSFEYAWGTLFAKPGTAEKGYTDVHITVRAPGGHSSVPTDHTSIGILSELITRIESEQYQARLVDSNPYYTQLQCGAAYSPEFPSKLKKLLSRRLSSASSPHGACKAKPDHLALEAAKQGPAIKYLMQTSQAVDVISGGIKVNALPERATAVVNHRINIGETTQVVKDRLAALAGAVARKHNLTLHAFDGKEEPSSIILSPSAHELEAAPVTPADGSVRGPFSVLAGTTRALYGEEVVVTPGIMTGNTDTRYYWDLTRHIFRFAPGLDPEDGPGLGAIHTVDERVSVLNHVNSVKWFTLFVRNMDEAEL